MDFRCSSPIPWHRVWECGRAITYLMSMFAAFFSGGMHFEWHPIWSTYICMSWWIPRFVIEYRQHFNHTTDFDGMSFVYLKTSKCTTVIGNPRLNTVIHFARSIWLNYPKSAPVKTKKQMCKTKLERSTFCHELKSSLNYWENCDTFIESIATISKWLFKWLRVLMDA